MFLDERGRRRHVVRLLGVLGGLLSAAAVTVVVIGAFGFVHVSPLPARARPVSAWHGPALAATVVRRGDSRHVRDGGGRSRRPRDQEVLAWAGAKAAP